MTALLCFVLIVAGFAYAFGRWARGYDGFIRSNSRSSFMNELNRRMLKKMDRE